MIGASLGPYRIERELGSGGMGTVYRAVGPDGVVALKVVHAHLLDGDDAVARFRREVAIGETVAHPNVVRTLQGGESQGRHYLAMEYVEGQTLQGLREDLERVPEELCLHIAREVARGLAAIHAAGAVHRDLKPENVLITREHVVKVMDLGAARLIDEAVALSRTGMFVGSLCYASPEQFQGGGKQIDGRADLHALGLVLYELAGGVCPFQADEVPHVVRKVLHEEPRRLGELNPQVSAFFEELVHKLLAKDRAERFASADAFLEVLTAGEASDWWRARATEIRAVTKRPLRRIRVPRETAVYGRDQEIARLREAFDAAKHGDGRVVLIEGEAGIGKSRLVDELVAHLHTDGEDVNFLFGSYPPGGAATAAGAWSTAYREQFGAAGCAEYLTATPVLAPAFDALLRGEPTPQGHETLTKDSLQTCFVNGTYALAGERPTVILIDDLHFAPEEGRALFTSVAMSVPGHRVLLVGTTRPGVPENWLSGATRLDQTSQMSLHRLGPKDLVRLLRDTLRSERLATELGGQIALKSDGNPFFVFEILRGLREGQFITKQDDGSWVDSKVIDDIQIPSTVLDLVNARVAELNDDERAMLDVAACWGFAFDPGLVGDVLGLARIPTLRSFAQIERRHRLVRAAGRTMVFDHHQVQEALYASLLEQLREEYHSALAETLETRTRASEMSAEDVDGALCVDLCEHYLKGARGERAVRYLEAAHAHLTAGYLHGQAVALTERALAVPGLLAGTERAHALLRLCRALTPIARRDRGEEAAREAERLSEEAGDDGLRGQAAGALGSVFRHTSRYDDADAAFARALELAVAAGDRFAEAAAMANRGLVLRIQGRLAVARESHERALAIFRELGDRRGEAREIGNLGLVLEAQGEITAARVHYEEDLAVHRELGDRKGETTATGNLGSLLHGQGRLVEALEFHERALALSCEIGDRQRESAITGNIGIVLYSQGRLSDARKKFRRHLALSSEIGHRQGEGIAQHNLGASFGEGGDFELAEEHLLTALAICEEIGSRRVTALTHRMLGSVRAAAGDENGARESLIAAREMADEMGLADVATLARCHLACVAGGDPADALAAVEENESRLGSEELLEARYLLFRATGERAHLVEAKRLLDAALANASEEHRESMLTNLRLNRDVMASWEQSGASD